MKTITISKNAMANDLNVVVAVEVSGFKEYTKFRGIEYDDRKEKYIYFEFGS